MEGGDLELGELLAAAEAAPPGESVDVVAHDLHKRFGAERVSFLFVDLIGQRLVRLAAAGGEVPDHAESIELQGSVYDSVLRSQRQHVEPDGQGGRRVITPVSNRGDCIGVLEVTLQSADDTVLRQVRDAAHALAYIIVTDRRFTDLYHLGRRTTETSLAAEIQHQLLPSAPCCEAAEFTLAAGLIPADDIGGDTYDYTLDRDTLHLSITDAMGHDTHSALLATLLVGALRRARRTGCDALMQANHAHQPCCATAAAWPPASCCASTWEQACANWSTPAIPGRCGCATAPSKRSSSPSTCPSVWRHPSPTAYRNCNCAPETV